MNAVEIIAADSQKRGLDPKRVLQSVSEKAKQRAVIMKQNNSVLVCLPITPTAIETDLYTIDAPVQLMQALVVFIQHLHNSQIEFIYGNESDNQLLVLLKRLNVNIEPSNIPNFDWMGRVK